MNDWCLRPRLCTVRPHWTGDNLGIRDEFRYESCPWRTIDCMTYWPAVQRATTVSRMPPISLNRQIIVHNNSRMEESVMGQNLLQTSGNSQNGKQQVKMWQ